MIQLKELSLQRGKNRLLDKVDLTIHSAQKVGIIGANGTGKSSLFKLLLGELHQDEGELYIPSALRVAHMAQEVATLERHALDYVLDGDRTLRQIEAALDAAEQQEQAERIGELHGQMESIDGYSARSRAEQLLHGLGFSNNDFIQPLQSFSGGWRIRLNLAQALMCPSDLLLLDEPTNHLDLDATLWLEQWLRVYQGTLLLISHDRDFLDRVVLHIAHFEQRKIQLYRGNYSAFEGLRAERLAQQQSSYKKQQERIAHIELFVRRFKAKATKAKQAQSRVKELERMERIAPAHVDSPFSFSFTGSDKVSSPLITLDEAAVGYRDKPLLSGINLSLYPEMRLGLLGPNGAGKSTLIKTLVGDLSVLEGECHRGEHLKVGYFAQHQLEALDLDASPLLHLQRLSAKVSEQELRNFLGSFGFLGDAALDTVRHFSGGEKARLALAIIAWQRPNLLLMDEPTNHLDLEVRHALTMALQEFNGAIIMVSHDRHLLRNCVDQFLLVNEGQVEVFDGDLDDYSRLLSDRERKRDSNASTEALDIAAKGEQAQDRKERKRLEAERRARTSPLRKRVSQLEELMGSLHVQQTSIEEQLADATLYEENNKEQLKQLLQTQARLNQQSSDTEHEWLIKSEELEDSI
jgi:ATP-binding cassette subfamily F protein 3